jgi:hypothetical protein
MKQAQAINQQNAINMCYMNAQKERGSGAENFGERITEFGVVVEKLLRFEVPGTFLQISQEK